MRHHIVKLIKTVLHLFLDPLERFTNRLDEKFSCINTSRGWSIVLITGAKDLNSLEPVLRSIETELAGTPAEVVIVGPACSRLNTGYGLPIKHFAYRDSSVLKPLITRKKNLGVALCQYDKVVLIHDYLLFEPGWKKGWDDYGDSFEVGMNRVHAKDGSRYRDWLVWDYPNIGPGLLPYSAEATRYQYISGAYLVAKRAFLLANKFNESLRWGEGEDLEWSQRIRGSTIFRFNRSSAVRCAKLKDPINERWDQNTVALQKIFPE